MRYVFFLLSIWCIGISPTYAAKKTAPLAVQLAAGQKTGTYYAFGRDLAAELDVSAIELRVLETEGSADNIKRMSRSERSGQMGIVQSDVLGFLRRSQHAPSQHIVSRLRVLYPFYTEEVHVLARKEIQDFRDLQGKKVAIGEEGSGHMLTAVNLFAIEQIVPSEIQKIAPEQGVVGVLKGDLDAVIFVGGKPVKLFKNLEDLTKPENIKFALMLQHVHFLPLSSSKFYEEYEPTEITPRDYSFVKSTVPTVAVQAVLVSYEHEKNARRSKRCEMITRVTQALRAALPQLKENGHPKWKEVTLSGEVVGWKKDPCLLPASP